MKLLVVDDEKSICDLLEIVFKRDGYQVTTASSGRAAMALILKESFDLIISDIKMPGMDGVETLVEMKKKKPQLPVVMLTGHATVASGIQGLKQGAFAYVMKPVALDELLDKLQKAFERKPVQEG